MVMGVMRQRRVGEGGLVYSTDSGRMCPLCRRPQAACCCGAPVPVATPPAACQVRVSRETQGRGGKTATVVRGVLLGEADFAALGKRLRNACGAGGTAKDGVLVVQGDHVDKVVAALLAEGWPAKRAGG